MYRYRIVLSSSHQTTNDHHISHQDPRQA